MKRGRGSALVTVIVLGTLGALVALTLAALATSHLNQAMRYDTRLDAAYLAEDALARTLEALRTQPGLGQSNETITFEPDAARPDRRGYVTFGAGESQNGLDDASGQAVLIGHGIAGRTHRRIQLVVQVPRYPYVLASEGPIASNGRLSFGVPTAAGLPVWRRGTASVCRGSVK